MVFAGQRGYADACKQATGGWPGKPAGAAALGCVVTKLRPATARKGQAAMAAETEFRIGAEASCSDGHCGHVSRMIVDPAARTVTHLVISPKHGHEPGRIVPLDLVESAAGEIRLSCTLAEFDRLDRAEEIDMVDGV